MDFADMLSALREEVTRDEPPRPLPEAVVMELREHYARFIAPNPYKPGDLVTHRAGVNLSDVGEPAIVIETYDPPLRTQDAHNEGLSPGSFLPGATFTCRAIRLADGMSYVAFLYHHSELAPYTGPGA